MPQEEITLKDSRKLSFERFGAKDGIPLVYLHGFPTSRLEASLAQSVAANLGISIIAPDRPGFGLSDFQKNRRLSDWPHDLVQLADALGLRRFNVIGVSGGGPYALACACLIPDRIERTCLVCGLGPTTERDLLSKMHSVARFTFGFAARCPRTMTFFYRFFLGPFLLRFPQLAVQLVALKAPFPDKRVLHKKSIRAMFLNAIGEGFRAGIKGALQDLVLYSNPWGFDIEKIPGEVILWHGKSDITVPSEFSSFASRKIPNSVLHLVENEGHYSLPVLRIEEILKSAVGLES